MKALLLYLLLIPYPLLLSAQADSGFTNKAEAKNQMVNGKKEGKWCEYLNSVGDTDSKNPHSPYYSLTIYDKGDPYGKVRIYYKNGKLDYEATYFNYKIYGMEKSYWENGKISEETPYSNGKINGVRKVYYKSGRLEGEYHFVNDTANGLNKGYYENGKLRWEALYSKSQETGVEKDYDEKGRLKSEVTYYDGHFVSRKDYDENGKEIK